MEDVGVTMVDRLHLVTGYRWSVLCRRKYWYI